MQLLRLYQSLALSHTNHHQSLELFCIKISNYLTNVRLNTSIMHLPHISKTIPLSVTNRQEPHGAAFGASSRWLLYLLCLLLRSVSVHVLYLPQSRAPLRH